MANEKKRKEKTEIHIATHARTYTRRGERSSDKQGEEGARNQRKLPVQIYKVCDRRNGNIQGTEEEYKCTGGEIYQHTISPMHSRLHKTRQRIVTER